MLTYLDQTDECIAIWFLGYAITFIEREEVNYEEAHRYSSTKLYPTPY